MPVSALLDGKTDSAVGDVVGSNLFNRLFIPGVSALIAAPVVNIQRVRQEATIMIGSSLLLPSGGNQRVVSELMGILDKVVRRQRALRNNLEAP
jgi:cation:H+ antiporter